MKKQIRIFIAASLAAAGWLLQTANIMAADAAPFKAVVTGSGPPMILIPGLACGGNVWDGTVAHFKGQYQIHVLTLAGFAGQPPIDGPFLDKVRDGIIKYIHDEKLDHPVVIGHSLGGMMAFWLGETDSKDLGPLIAVDGLPFFSALRDPATTEATAKSQAEMLRGMYANLSTEDFVKNNHLFLGMMMANKTNLETVASLGDKSNPKAVGQAFYDLFTTDLRPNLKKIEPPVLLIGSYSGAADDDAKAKVRESYESQISTVPHHKLVFSPTAMHFIQLDEPEFFYKQVELFLKENKK